MTISTLMADANAARSTSPRKLSVAGPGHQHVVVASRAIRWQACRRRAPPRTLRSASPRRYAATAAAQAPVPQASVMPTPRSHTRMRKDSARTHFDEFDIGARGEPSDDARCRAQARPPAPFPHPSTNSTQCGLPIETAAALCSALSSNPSTDSANDVVSTACARGISCQSRRGAPMSTVDQAAAGVVQTSGPPAVSI